MLVYRSVLHVLFRSMELGFKLLERWTCFVGTIWDGTRGLWCSAGFWREDHSWQLELQSNQVWGMCPRKNPSTLKKNEKVKRLMNVSALGKLFALSILCLVFFPKEVLRIALTKHFWWRCHTIGSSRWRWWGGWHTYLDTWLIRWFKFKYLPTWHGSLNFVNFVVCRRRTFRTEQLLNLLATFDGLRSTHGHSALCDQSFVYLEKLGYLCHTATRAFGAVYSTTKKTKPRHVTPLRCLALASELLPFLLQWYQWCIAALPWFEWIKWKHVGSCCSRFCKSHRI